MLLFLLRRADRIGVRLKLAFISIQWLQLDDHWGRCMLVLIRLVQVFHSKVIHASGRRSEMRRRGLVPVFAAFG